MTLNGVGDFLLYSTTATLLLFILYYNTTAPWWRSAEGRYLMTSTAATFAVFVYLTTAVAGGLSPNGKAWVRLVVYGAFLFIAAYQLSLVIRAQCRGRLRARLRAAAKARNNL